MVEAKGVKWHFSQEAPHAALPAARRREEAETTVLPERFLFSHFFVLLSIVSPLPRLILTSYINPEMDSNSKTHVWLWEAISTP